MDTVTVLTKLSVSVGLGLLIGLQRERKGEEIAGIRTFALVSVLGTIAALLGKHFDHGVASIIIVSAGALGLAALLTMGAFLKARIRKTEIGLTTEVAALVVYGIGAYLVDGDLLVATVLSGIVVLLLFWKDMLHGFVRKMGDQDVSAIMTFVLIAMVIWPILPNQTFGPYNFFNPFETWLVVVLVVGMSLGGYVLYKFVPPTAGALLGGAVGGLISSTATTVSYARRARSDPATAPLAAQAIMMANTVSVCRIIVLLALFAGPAIEFMILPLATMAGIMALLTAITFWAGRHDHAELPHQGNPTELKAALLFAAIYTAVKLGTAWGKATFGTAAIYVIAGISGLTDVDAITLSMAQTAHTNASLAHTAWHAILIAILANLLFKAATVLTLGSPRLKKWTTILFSLALAAGVAIILLWPY